LRPVEDADEDTDEDTASRFGQLLARSRRLVRNAGYNSWPYPGEVATLASNTRIEVPRQRLAEFCRRHHIRRLSLFGSVLGEGFGPESDVDVLVEFEADKVPGLFRLAGLEMELSEILGGRKVDMNTPKCLSSYFRDKVVAEAEELYVRP
jgi:hypothetical protein